MTPSCSSTHGATRSRAGPPVQESLARGSLAQGPLNLITAPKGPGPVRAVRVAVPLASRQDVAGVGPAHDQDVVEHLASDAADAPPAVGVHPRSPRGTQDHPQPLGHEDRGERRTARAVAVTRQKPQRLDVPARAGGEMPRPLPGPLPVRAARDSRQAGPERRGAGPVPAASRISRTVEAAIRSPSRVSSPLDPSVPHRGLSRADRRTSALTAAGAGGRPVHSPT